MTLNPQLALRRAFGRQMICQLSRLVNDRFQQRLAADVESEQRFRDQVSQKFPDDPVAGEELGSDPGADQNGWLIDPLDGSTNHSQGIPLFAVSIAYRTDGVTLLGWVSDPVRGEWFEGLKGKGVLCGGSISPSGYPGKVPMICLSPRWRGAHPTWREHLPRGLKQRSIGSIALEMAWIAAGRVDAAAWYRTQPWDVCAGELLIQESGGKVIDIPNGGPGEKIAGGAGATSLLNALQATIDNGGGDARNKDPV